MKKVEQMNFVVPLFVSCTPNPNEKDLLHAVEVARTRILGLIKGHLPEQPSDKTGIVITSVSAKAGSLERVSALYKAASSLYRSTMFQEAKTLLRAICQHKEDDKEDIYIDVQCPYEGGDIERMGKYFTPRDYADNFILYGFGLEKGSLFADGMSVDDVNRRTTFSEYDLSNDEIGNIVEILDAVKDGIENGVYTVSGDGAVNAQENL